MSACGSADPDIFRPFDSASHDACRVEGFRDFGGQALRVGEHNTFRGEADFEQSQARDEVHAGVHGAAESTDR